MSKHTPGPWSAEGVTSEADHDIVLGYDIPGQGCPIMLATVFSDHEDDNYPITLQQANANAKLIASAPDLLAALQAMVKWEQCRPGGFPCPHLEQANAAISQALGEVKR